MGFWGVPLACVFHSLVCSTRLCVPLACVFHSLVEYVRGSICCAKLPTWSASSSHVPRRESSGDLLKCRMGNARSKIHMILGHGVLMELRLDNGSKQLQWRLARL